MAGPIRNFKTVPSLYALIVKDNKVLMHERINTGYQDRYYGLVSGHKEADEKATDGLIREAKEEAGIDINPTELDFVHIMHRIKENREDERIDLFFTVSAWQGHIINAEPHKHKDHEWIPLDSLPSNTIPFIRTAIENWRQGKIFSEFFEASD